MKIQKNPQIKKPDLNLTPPIIMKRTALNWLDLFTLANRDQWKKTSVLESFGAVVKNEGLHIGSVDFAQQVVMPFYKSSHKIHSNPIIIDVRSPVEYEKGHIPGAKNIPLFDDTERSRVGTAFKKNGGRVPAMKLGLRYVIPKFSTWANQLCGLCGEQKVDVTEEKATSEEKAVEKAQEKAHRVYIYCSRGGFRSHSFAWLFRHHYVRLLEKGEGNVSGHQDNDQEIGSKIDATLRREPLDSSPPPHIEWVILEEGYKGFLRWAREGVYDAESYHNFFSKNVSSSRYLQQAIYEKTVDSSKVGGSSKVGDSGKTEEDSGITAPNSKVADNSIAAVADISTSATSIQIPPLCIVGGRSGSGKTAVLHSLQALGENVIDLEGLANHRGSTFGQVGQRKGGQPKAQMYDAIVALEYCFLVMRTLNSKRKEDDDSISSTSEPAILSTTGETSNTGLSSSSTVDLDLDSSNSSPLKRIRKSYECNDTEIETSTSTTTTTSNTNTLHTLHTSPSSSFSSCIFIEDEGPSIGKLTVPPRLYQEMRDADHIFKLIVPLEIRTNVLVGYYASPAIFANEGSVESWRQKMNVGLKKIRKRISKTDFKELTNCLDSKNYHKFAKTTLEKYYDPLYDKHINNANGTGTGGGQRNCQTMVEVEHGVIDGDQFFAEHLAEKVRVLAKGVFNSKGE